jgi:diguanylate cyclase (GGDEF)-like protein/PAS domain S-box-containing protein
MNLQEEAVHLKTQRLQRLKERAQQLLSQVDKDQPDGLSDRLQTTKLLEDLRIYQVELELQNDELRDAQQEADLARKRYQTLFAQMPLAALVVDDKGVVDDCNAQAEVLLGQRKRFVSQDTRLWQKLSRDDRNRLRLALRELAPGQTEVLANVGLGEPGPQSPVFDLHLMGLSMDYKLDRRVLLLLVDRTAEVARLQDQRFYTELLDSSDSFIYAVDPQGKFLLANQPLLDFFGRTREDVQHQPRDKFLPLRDAILHNEADQKVLQSGQALTLEEQVHLAAPSSRLDFLTRKFPLHDLAGRIYGVGGISTDITALKDQHRQTLLSETVFMSASDAIIITDPDTCIVRVNPAFTRQTGFSAAGVLGRKTNILKSGRQDKVFYAALWQALLEKGQWSGEINNRRADGSYYTIWSSINAVCDAQGQVLHYIAVQTDVTQLHNAKLALAHQASYDHLTGLPNRSLFNDRITQLVASSIRHKKPFALLFIDLDRFKEVNDTLGHQVGDVLLCEVSRRLQDGVRREDTVARIGGDEFVVLLPGTDAEGAQAVAANLLGRLREPIQLEQTPSYRPMASVGLSVFPHDGDSPDLLLRNADLAMYAAKIDGRNRVAIYRPEMSLVNDQAFAIQIDLAEAIEQGQLRVFFQPKCRLSDGALMGAEALVRWQRPGNGLVLPGEFIGLAEKCGLLMAIDHWVMNEALRQVGCWAATGLWHAPWRLAVNQNVADLQRPDMLAELKAMLHTHGVSATALELEITEDSLLQHTDEQLARLGELRDMGVSVSIDDFGTGYSSLAYLRQLPVSVIKIDISFVRGMLTNDNDAVLVRTIVDMAHNLGHTLVAEGIELLVQHEQLTALGCELGQGYLFGKPVSAEEFAARWLGSNDK